MPQNDPGAYRYTIHDCELAAQSGEVIYAPHVLKGMIFELVARIYAIESHRPNPFTLWRGDCGHYWDRTRFDTAGCPECELQARATKYRRASYLLAAMCVALMILVLTS